MQMILPIVPQLSYRRQRRGGVRLQHPHSNHGGSESRRRQDDCPVKAGIAIGVVPPDDIKQETSPRKSTSKHAFPTNPPRPAYAGQQTACADPGTRVLGKAKRAKACECL